MEISRFEHIEPTWGAPKAKEPGYLRHFLTLVSSKDGAEYSKIGIVRQPPGNRSYKLHYHEIEEVYFVLEGKAEVWSAEKKELIGKHECAFFPPREEHAYRNVGNNTLIMLYVTAGSEHDRKKEEADNKMDRYDESE